MKKLSSATLKSMCLTIIGIAIGLQRDVEGAPIIGTMCLLTAMILDHFKKPEA